MVRNIKFKAAVVERFNETLKNIIFKYCTISKSTRFIDVLPRLTAKYNDREHSATGMAPIRVNYFNRGIIPKKILEKDITLVGKAPVFSVGDSVRIAEHRLPFTEGFKKTYTDEVFQVSEVREGNLVTYKLKDQNSNPVESCFHSQELVLALT